MAQSHDEILDSYLNKGGIYLEIYYLLLKLAKPDSGRYRLKVGLDEIFQVASETCKNICRLQHPEAEFSKIWYGIRECYRRYETDLIFSVVYTLLKCVPVKGKNFVAMYVEIEDKNSNDSTYFPHFKELAENWLKGQQQSVAPIPTSPNDILLKQIEALQKENEMLKLKNAELEEKVRDLDFYKQTAHQAQYNNRRTITIEKDENIRIYSFEDLLAYAKSRQSYGNSVQILDMLNKFLRRDGTKLLWQKLDETEQYLLSRDGGSINIEKNFGSLMTNEKGGLVLNLSSPKDKQQLIDFLKANNINLIEK